MKKAFKITLIIIISAAILAISIFTAIVISSADEIIGTEKDKIIPNSIHMTHKTKKGEEIMVPVSMNTKILGEDLYLIDAFFHRTDNEKYSAKHARFEVNLDQNAEILMMFYSAGDGSNYVIPSISYNDDNNWQTFKCSSDDGYIHLSMLLSGEEAKNLKLNVKYSIIVKGIYSFNKFYGFEEAFGFEDFN